MHAHALMALLTGAIVFLPVTLGAKEVEPVSKGKVVAINVLLLPDQQMSARARDLNRRLRETYPDGFALDDSHVPHISILHLYVRDGDLPGIFAAVHRVVVERSVVGIELTAKGLRHS